jgi:HTH-type transcriptional regulator/antitoxin HigA
MTAANDEHSTQNPEKEFQDAVEAIKFYMEAQGLTQKDLVPMIGSRSKVSEVLSGARGITMPMARALHRHLGIPADVLLKEPVLRSGEAAPEIDWRRFPLSQMAKRGWIRDSGDLRENAKELVTELMHKADHTQVAALYRKNDQNRANAKTNPYALNAWCWQILAQANEKDQGQAVQRVENPLELMSEVAKLSPATDGPLRAVDFLAEQGIAVEIARHLPGTHLDGAAMKSSDGLPVIGLTLRYDRVDHFWYTLEHELAHALYHLDDNSGSFFDDLGLDSVGDKEEYADEKAKESLIPTDVWMSSEVGKKRSPMAVIGLAHELGIHPAIVAGRARHEEQDYRRWSQLLGSGTVRGLFGV